MRKEILLSGISEKSYDRLIASLEKRGEDELTKIHSFIYTIYHDHYLPILRIWREFTEDYWIQLESMYGSTRLPEQRWLREHRRNLKNYWIENITEVRK